MNKVTVIKMESSKRNIVMSKDDRKKAKAFRDTRKNRRNVWMLKE